MAWAAAKGQRTRTAKRIASEPRPRPAADGPRIKRPLADYWIYAVVIAICTLAVYFPVHHHPFSINDDEQYVVRNPHLQHGLDWETVRWAFTTHDLANWHPLTWLSHAADVQMFQLNPAGHHDLNLVFHLLSAVLLFWVLQRATGLTGRNFMVAALFALHPINVETVAWIAERKSLLSVFFFLLGLGAYRWYASRPGISRYGLVTVLFAMGLLAKPQIVTFPFVLLLWDYWPLRRFPAAGDDGADELAAGRGLPRQSWSRLVLEKLPWLALSAGSAVMTMRAQRLAGALRYYPFSYRLENGIVSYVRYIGKAFWPSPLIPFYPHSALAAWQVAGSLLLLLAITGLVIVCRRRQPYMAVGWFWFLGTLVPMLGIVQVGEQAMADRYAYLSFVGLFLMVCWGVAAWAAQKKLASGWLIAPSAAVLLILFVLTPRQLSYWSSNVSLWAHDLSVTPDSIEAEQNLGEALLEGGEPEEAMEHFKRVAAEGASGMGRDQVGDAAVAHLYLGAFDQQRGQPEAALEHYRAVLALANAYSTENVYANVPPVLQKIKATALANMGYADLGLDRLTDAKVSFRDAVQLDPHAVREWTGLGLVEQKQGDIAGAVEAYSQAAHLESSDVNLLLLAQALERNGQMQEARAARQKAVVVSVNIDAAERSVERTLKH